MQGPCRVGADTYTYTCENLNLHSDTKNKTKRLLRQRLMPAGMYVIDLACKFSKIAELIRGIFDYRTYHYEIAQLFQKQKIHRQLSICGVGNCLSVRNPPGGRYVSKQLSIS